MSSYEEMQKHIESHQKDVARILTDIYERGKINPLLPENQTKIARPPSPRHASRPLTKFIDELAQKHGLNLESPPAKLPPWSPMSRETFLQRLETYHGANQWPSKPASINEVAWSKLGWVCTADHTVSCVCECGGSVFVDIPDEGELHGGEDEHDADQIARRIEVRDKLVETYKVQMLEAHGKYCLWRTMSSDDAIQHLQIYNNEAATWGVLGRYQNIMKMVDHLPSKDIIQTPEGFDLKTIIEALPEMWSEGLQKLPEASNVQEDSSGAAPEPMEGVEESTPQQPAGTPTSMNEAALALAFLGWDYLDDGNAGILNCRACFQRLGLWLYKPKPNGDDPVCTSLDVGAEHMDYCPWINREAQSGGMPPGAPKLPSKCGWEMVTAACKARHEMELAYAEVMGPIIPGSESESDLESDDDDDDDDDLDSDDDEELLNYQYHDEAWYAKMDRILAANDPENFAP
ncbi:C3HC zinc finger-like-domain-containing protein [Penicillium malachiteum]|nr:C3HC zinc finger-like-domain-containing protein [Penicillium malachiteum]